MHHSASLALQRDHASWDGSSCPRGGGMGLTWLQYLTKGVSGWWLMLKHGSMGKPGCIQHRNSTSKSKHLSCSLKELRACL